MQGGGTQRFSRSAGHGGFWLPCARQTKPRAGAAPPLSHTCLPGGSRSPCAVFLCRSHSGEQVGGLPTSGNFPGTLQGRPVGEQPLGPAGGLLPSLPENKGCAGCWHHSEQKLLCGGK